MDELDLGDLESVRGFAERFLAGGRDVDIVINSAAVMACPETRIGPGWEAQFATNHLGHFALVNRLWPAIAASGGARVVSVSSAGHRRSGIRWDDLHFERGYDKWQAYGQAKTANVLFALRLAEHAGPVRENQGVPMPIQVAGRRRSAETLARHFPGAHIIDVTSKAADPWVRLSPFYPHGSIPVPRTPGVTAQSVEGIWQALKVFATEDVDPSRLEITRMAGIKRTVRKYGPVRGHRDGLYGERLLPYETARRRIYLPAYRWVLEHRTADLCERLVALAREHDVVLLDYTTNGDVADPSAPLSHAALIRLHLLGRWPDQGPDRGYP